MRVYDTSGIAGITRFRSLSFVMMTMLLMLCVGCSSPKTRIAFEGPPGSVLMIDDKPYHLPASVELTRSSKSGESKRYDASFAGTVDSRELRAKGHLDLFGYSESNIDEVSVNTCYLLDPQLVKLFDGSVVVFRGQSASRQPLYDLTLRK